MVAGVGDFEAVSGGGFAAIGAGAAGTGDFAAGDAVVLDARAVDADVARVV